MQVATEATPAAAAPRYVDTSLGWLLACLAACLAVFYASEKMIMFFSSKQQKEGVKE